MIETFALWNDVKDVEWTAEKSGNSISVTVSKSGLDNGKKQLKSVFALIDKN